MKSGHSQYLKIILVLILFSLVLVFGVNYFVDPLWYFGGNKLFPENYSFNERFSKTNEYIKEPKKYDCIILGSSRVTLLDADKISGYTCFNFSFSDGNPSEFVEYSKYIRKFGNKPKLVIIGIDSRFYSRKKYKTIVPDFVKLLDLPPTVFKSYLSVNSFKFSILTLLRKPPQHRYYTENLIGDVLPGTKDYQPPDCFTLEGFGLPFTDKNTHFLTNIQEILQADVFVAYVAPISAWDMMPLLEDSEIDSYTALMYQISKLFDRFYDFSVPSELTKRTDNNYDGHHFRRNSNDEIANILNGETVKYGLAVHSMSFTEYKRTFISALENFSETLENTGKSSWNCSHRTAVR